MAHNTLVRASLAAWGANATITAAELWALDMGQFVGINGDAGGTWAPSSVITIGGSGLTVTGDCRLAGASSIADCQGFTLTNTGELLVSDGTHVLVEANGWISLEGELRIENGGLLEVRSGADVSILAGSAVNVASAVTVSSGGSITIASGGSFTTASGATVTLGADATRTGRETLSGINARTVRRVTSPTANTNTAPNVNYDIWLVTINDGNTYTATLEITSPAPVLGEQIIVRKIGTSGTLSVASQGPIVIANIGPGQSGCVTCVFDGTQWRLISIWRSDYAGISSGA